MHTCVYVCVRVRACVHMRVSVCFASVHVCIHVYVYVVCTGCTVCTVCNGCMFILG